MTRQVNLAFVIATGTHLVWRVLHRAAWVLCTAPTSWNCVASLTFRTPRPGPSISCVFTVQLSVSGDRQPARHSCTARTILERTRVCVELRNSYSRLDDGQRALRINYSIFYCPALLPSLLLPLNCPPSDQLPTPTLKTRLKGVPG